MYSQIVWRLNADRTITQVEKGTTKLYAGSVCTPVYALVGEDLRDTDVIFIVATRNGKSYGQKLKRDLITYKDGTTEIGFSMASNGNELNFALESGTEQISFNFNIKRYSTLNEDLILEQFNSSTDIVNVYPSNSYYPQLEASDIDNFMQELALIERDIGVLNELSTENKDNLVGAINEVNQKVDANKEDLENAIQDLDDKKVDKRYESPDVSVYSKINTINNNDDGISLTVIRRNNVGSLSIRDNATLISSGSKFLTITPNSVTINGKEVLTDDVIAERIELHNQDEDAHPAIREEIEGIKELIPNQASQTNQLADKNFVTDVVQTNTSNFRGNWNDFANVPEDSEYYPEDYAGNKKPTENDYIAIVDASDYHSEEIFTKEGETEGYYISATGQMVANVDFAYSDELELDDKDKAVTLRATGISGRIFRVHAYDEEHNWIQEVISGQSTGELVLYGTLPEDTKYLRVSYPKVADDIELYTHLTLGSWRFKYTGNWDNHGKAGWIPEYKINDTPFTAAQLETINSGLVAEDKEKINNSLQKDNVKTINGESIEGSGDIPVGSEPDGTSITENTDGEIQAVALKGKSITVTDDDIVYGDYEGSVDFESQADYESFVQNGSITKNGKTIYYSKTGRYTTPENGGSGGLVIQTTETVQVEGYQVPKLTPEQVTAIYNALASGSTAVVTDPTGNYHFGIDQADNMAGIISCEYKFFNTMYVTYELDNNTVTVTGSLIGGGQLYMHSIKISGNNYYAKVILYTQSSTPLTRRTLGNYLYTNGYRDKNTYYNGAGMSILNNIVYDFIGLYCSDNLDAVDVCLKNNIDFANGTYSKSVSFGVFGNSATYSDTVTPL